MCLCVVVWRWFTVTEHLNGSSCFFWFEGYHRGQLFWETDFVEYRSPGIPRGIPWENMWNFSRRLHEISCEIFHRISIEHDVFHGNSMRAKIYENSMETLWNFVEFTWNYMDMESPWSFHMILPTWHKNAMAYLHEIPSCLTRSLHKKFHMFFFLHGILWGIKQRPIFSRFALILY